jgi:hypothetical protein
LVGVLMLIYKSTLKKILKIAMKSNKNENFIHDEESCHM